MRVVHVIPVMDPATGGPPAVVAAVCSVLRVRGVDAGVVCYEVPEAGERVGGVMEEAWRGAMGGDSPLRDERGRDARVPLDPKVPIELLPPISGLEVPFAGNARRLLPGKLERADVVHLHGVWDPVIRVAGAVCREKGIPYVISTHGMLEPWAINQKRWKKELFWRLGWEALLQGAAGIHDYRAGPIRVLGRELRPRVWEIANGIFPGSAPSRKETEGAWTRLCARYPMLKKGKVVVSIGRLAKQKGPDLLFWAHRELVSNRKVEATLLMAGRDEGWRSGLGWHSKFLPDDVVLPGSLFGEEKAAILAHADVWVLPSRHEGFSVAVLEAMNAGLPCVISDACHFDHSMEAGASRVVPIGAGDVKTFRGFAEAMAEVLKYEAVAEEMGRRGRELVEREYTWGKLVSKYEEMYNVVARR